MTTEQLQSVARLAKGIRIRARNYTTKATKESRNGNIIECITNTTKAAILIDIAQEFEHEAYR